MSNLILPKIVDIPSFCASNAQFKVQIPLAQFERLAELTFDGHGEIDLALEFKQQNRRNLMVTNVKAELNFTCQRCLNAIKLNLVSQTKYLLVKSAPLSDVAEFEVIITADELMLYPLLEDELLLSIPTNITHNNCLMPEFKFKAHLNTKINPFATLAQLYKS